MRRVMGWFAVLAIPGLIGALRPAAVARPPVLSSLRPTAPVTAFVNVAVIPMDRERVLTSQTVGVRDGRIAALGPVGSVPVPPDAVRIEAEGKFLIPGLADMHFHLKPGGTANAERQLFLLVANGVTTIRNVDYQADEDYRGDSHVPLSDAEALRLRDRAAAGELVSPRIYTSGRWRSDPEQNLEASLTAYRAAGYDFLKIHDESRSTLDSMLPIARRLGVSVMGHTVRGGRRPRSLQSILQDDGYTSIEHFRGYEHVELADIPAVAAETRQAGVWNCPTMFLLEGQSAKRTDPVLTRRRRLLLPGAHYAPPGVLMYEARQPDTIPARLERWYSFVRTLQDSGAGLLLGTDVPLIGVPGFAVHLELQALVRAGLTPYEALATGTRNIAEFFGTQDSSGTIAVGRRADLVLLYGNPLDNIRQTALSAGVMLGGRWLAREEIDRQLARYAIGESGD